MSKCHKNYNKIMNVHTFPLCGLFRGRNPCINEFRVLSYCPSWLEINFVRTCSPLYYIVALMKYFDNMSLYVFVVTIRSFWVFAYSICSIAFGCLFRWKLCWGGGKRQGAEYIYRPFKSFRKQHSFFFLFLLWINRRWCLLHLFKTLPFVQILSLKGGGVFILYLF